MATNTQTIILVILVIVGSTIQDTSNNEIDDPLDEAKAAIMKEQDMQNIGGMLSNLMQSDGAKEIGGMLLNAATGEGGGQILQGLGAAMEMLSGSKKEKSDDSFDPNIIFSLMGNLMGGGGGGGRQGGNSNNILSYLPMILQALQSFMGPEAEQRAKAHMDHAGLLPPFMEKVHLMFDHFMNTDLAKALINNIGAEKYIRVFADDTGRYSYRKMVDMLENHSFRKHWLTMITNRIAKFISYISDLKMQRKYLTTFQHFVNSILKSQGYPKSMLLDIHRPVDSITAIINHTGKELLNLQIDAKPYVKPAVKYVQELFSLAQKRGMFVDQQQLSDKLADTINMEMIEPFARVNRGYRFALKTPECDKYVMCLVNQEPENDVPSLPGLRPLLSKTASYILSWFLTSRTGTPYLTLYNIISSETNCQKYYTDKCHDFHIEEIKVTTEYVHNEL